MTSDLTSTLTSPQAVAVPTPAVERAPEHCYPAPDGPTTLYVSEEFAQLLEDVTAARAEWDAVSDGHPGDADVPHPGPDSDLSRSRPVSWAPVAAGPYETTPSAVLTQHVQRPETLRGSRAATERADKDCA